MEFEIEQDQLDDPRAGEPHYNVAPTDTVPVVLERMAVPPKEPDEQSPMPEHLPDDVPENETPARSVQDEADA